jgi:hypothetical protein
VLEFLNHLWGARNSAGIVLSALQATEAGGTDSLESILGLLKSFKKPGLWWGRFDNPIPTQFLAQKIV